MNPHEMTARLRHRRPGHPLPKNTGMKYRTGRLKTSIIALLIYSAIIAPGIALILWSSA